MCHKFCTALLAAVIVATSIGYAAAQTPTTDDGQRRRPPETPPSGHAQPRGGTQPPADAQPRGETPPPQRSAQPRPPSSPPPRALPPHYDGPSHHYYFPPVSLQRGYYYHPYFGFYYGPYYGPFYPFPGPYFGPLPYGASAIRIKVKPVEAQVYANGYYAGIVDDFDGVFQRLYLPAGQHEIELHLDGYRNFRQRVYVGPGDTLDINCVMQPLSPGELNEPAPATQPLSPEWTNTPPPVAGDRPSSPFGILALRVEPEDAQIFVDDDAWAVVEGRPELVVHVVAGWHRLEIRRDGYQTFRTEVDLSEGATTRLNVKLVR